MSDGYRRKGDEMDVVASHQRVLLGACLRTTGPIVELCVGWYSTPLLHEIAVALGRDVLTVDNNEDWLRQFRPLECRQHALRLVGWWGELSALLDAVFARTGRIGLVFCDQGQPCEREYAVRALLGRARVFVLHDTEEGFAYGYDRVLGRHRLSADIPETGLFRYQWTDRCQRAWTTVCSDEVDVRDWFTELSPVEPVREVT